MNRLTFAVALWILLGLDLGLKPVIALGPTAIAPSLILPLVVFVALHAPSVAALWAGLIAGLMLDLTFPIAIDGGGERRVPGPAALGTLLAVAMVLHLRSMLIGRNPLTLVALTVAAGLVQGAVVVAMLTARSIAGDPISHSAAEHLLARAGSAVYSGLAAGILALVLFPAAGLFAFPSHPPGSRRFSART